jgi:hypothetical protein
MSDRARHTPESLRLLETLHATAQYVAASGTAVAVRPERQLFTK